MLLPGLHFLPTLAIVSLLFCSPLTGRAAEPPLRIGAWNLEQLGTRTEPERTEADLDALAAKIRDLGVSVLAVSEVNGWRTLRDLVRRIGPDWDGVLGRSGYLGGKPPKQIGIGFLWDTRRVELVGASDWKTLPRRSNGLRVFHRVPVSACFRGVAGGPDFRLVAVHLKAGFEPADTQKRSIELAEIKKRIDRLLATPGEDRDIAVLGDFNHSPAAPEHAILSEKGFSTYLAGDPPEPSIIHFDDQIDHIVPLAGFDEVRKSTFDVLDDEGERDKTAWRTRYSDHYPVVVELDPGPDDDPEARFTEGEAPLRPLSEFRD